MTADAEARTAEGGIDLAALRARLADAPDADRLRPIGLERIVAGPNALLSLPSVIADLPGVGAGPIALLVDATPMLRDRADLKATVQSLLESDREVRLVRAGPDDGRAHADEATVAAACEGARGATALVTVGSGTVADIGKAVAAELGGLPHVIVQTAASVNGFADDQSVLLRNGVKRTSTTRWPEVLVLDGAVLVDAPAEMNLAGFGDLVSMFTATADWHLAQEIGMDNGFSRTAVALGRDRGEELLDLAPALAHKEGAAVVRLAEILAISGISMGVAGQTAPSSGMEHTVSHLLEMAAARRGVARASLHGARVGVTTIVAALTWRHLKRRLAERGPALSFPSEAEMEERVRAAFDPLDPSGKMAEECWSDYSAKLARWHERRDLIERFAADWNDHFGVLDALLVDPVRLVEAMKTAGAPVRFTQLEPEVDAATARWAVAHCHLMRDRFTIADFAFFNGSWEAQDVDAVLADAAELGAGL
jgi:glycerol-1-phosphate dehydrogenase [NAD(P)+]